MRKGSWISKIPLSGGRESDFYYNADEGSLEEESEY